MNRKNMIEKMESYLSELKEEYEKYKEFRGNFKTEYYKNFIPCQSRKFEHQFIDEINLLEKMKDENITLNVDDYEKLDNFYNISLEYERIGEEYLNKMEKDELYLFIFGILRSFRGDWSDTETRTKAFNVASRKLVKFLEGKKKKDLERLIDKVYSFNYSDPCWRDGRDFRCKAPYGYYGAFDYIGITEEERKFSKNVIDALTFYCKYFDEEDYTRELSYKGE